MFFQFSFAKFIGNTKTKSRQPSMNWYKSTFGAERFFGENSYLWNEGQKKFYLLFFWLFGFTLQSYYWKSFSKNALNRKIFRKNVQFEGLLVWTSFYFSDFSARRKKCETPLLNWDHSFVQGKKAAALCFKHNTFLKRLHFSSQNCIWFWQKLENEKEFFAQTMFHCHNEKSNSKTSPIFKLEPMWKGSDATLKLTWICVIFAIFLEDWWVMKFERNIR